MSEFSVYLDKSKIRPGMILAADLYDRFGNILICSGTVLDDYFIDKIMGNDILDEVAIVDRRSGSPSDRDSKEKSINSMQIDMIRKKTSRSVKQSIDRLKEDNNQSMMVLFEIVERIIEEILESDNLVYEIERLQSVDSYVYSHVINTTVISILVGIANGLHKKELKSLAKAAFFSDSGKLQINPDIITKPGKLTEDEFEEVKKYPVYGYEFMSSFEEMDENALKGILEARERWDGNGYPNGLRGNEISLYGQIVGFSSYFDALTSNRAYKDAVNPYVAMTMAVKESGHSFSSDIVKKACVMLGYYSRGMLVKLKGGEIAKVITANRYKPVLAIVYDPNVQSTTRSFEIDMRKNPAVKIDEVLVLSDKEALSGKIDGLN